MSPVAVAGLCCLIRRFVALGRKSMHCTTRSTTKSGRPLNDHSFKRTDVVMILDRYDTEKESLGLDLRDSNEGDQWVKAEAKTSHNSTSMLAPGFSPDEVRHATDADLAAAPEWAQAWLQREQDRVCLQVDKLNPRVSAKTRRGTASLRQAGFVRVSDLPKVSDADLLALPGCRQDAGGPAAGEANAAGGLPWLIPSQPSLSLTNTLVSRGFPRVEGDTQIAPDDQLPRTRVLVLSGRQTHAHALCRFAPLRLCRRTLPDRYSVHPCTR